MGQLAELRDVDVRAVLDVAHELAGLETRAERVEVAMRRLVDLLDAELCGYNDIDFAAGSALVEFYPALPHLDGLAAQASQAMHDHPLIQHLATSRDRLPCRVSDLVSRREWLRTDAYAHVLKPVGTSNVLALPVRFTPNGGEGYAVARGGRDFSERECAVATAVQVALVAAHPPERKKPPYVGLTRREAEILVLLSQAHTAQTISRRLQISSRTVRKHLEHLYAKLGVQDRLAAVNRAREIGLI